MEDFEEILEYLRKFFPQQVMDKIVELRSDPFEINQKRYAVIMFADISGFTSISELLDAETVTEIINDIFKTLGKIVQINGGMTDKFLGDCILCVFGLLDGNEPEKDSVNAGLEMIKSLSAIREVYWERFKIDINISIGINSGEIIIGNIGYEDRMEYTVIGDVVNTASRIQHCANPGQILISDSVYRRIKNSYKFGESFSKSVKNKKESVMMYEVLDYKISESNDLNSFFVGREKELSFLNDIYTNTDKLKCVQIDGEAAIGKTTFLKHFIFKNKIEPLIFEADKSIAHNNFGPIVTGLLNKNRKFQIGSDNLKLATIDLISDMIIDNKNNGGPLLIVIEDIHYFDEDSINILKYVFEYLSKESILVLITNRDRDIKYLDVQEKISLVGLSSDETKLLISSITNLKVSEEISDFIYTKSMGRPYYIIELTNDLTDKELVNIDGVFCFKDNKIPELNISLSNIILQKIDKLNYEEKKLLKYASLYGVQISLNLLSFITKIDVEFIRQFLDRAKILNIAEKYIEKDVEYFRFLHQTVRSAIENSILKKQKETIHGEIAINYSNSLGYEKESSLPTLITEDAYKIAWHFEKANNIEKAIFFYIISGIYYKENSAISVSKEIFNKIENYFKNYPDDKVFGRLVFRDTHFESYFFGIYMDSEVNKSTFYYIFSLLFPINDPFYLSYLEKASNYPTVNKTLKYMINSNILGCLSYMRKIDIINVTKRYELLLRETFCDEVEILYFFDLVFTYGREYVLNGRIDDEKNKLVEFYEMLKNKFQNEQYIKDVFRINYNFIMTRYYYFISYVKSLICSSDDCINEIMVYVNKGKEYINNTKDMISYMNFCCFTSITDKDIEFEIYKSNLEIAEELNDQIYISQFSSSLGYYYMIKKDYEESEKCFLKNMNICLKADFTHELSMVYYNLSLLSLEKKDFEKAVYYGEKSIELKKKFPATYSTEDWTSIIFPYTVIIMSYYLCNKYSKCIEFINELESGITTKHILYCLNIISMVKYLSCKVIDGEHCSVSKPDLIELKKNNDQQLSKIFFENFQFD